MLRPTENLFMRPMFTLALNGEFRPPSDTTGSAHTLAKLAVATYSKGEVVFSRDGDLVEYYYVPTWAEGADAWVNVVTSSSDGPEDLTLLSVRNRLDEDQELTLVDGEKGDRGRGLAVINSSEERFFPLGLGDELRIATTVVAEEAQRFFEALRA